MHTKKPTTTICTQYIPIVNANTNCNNHGSVNYFVMKDFAIQTWLGPDSALYYYVTVINNIIYNMLKFKVILWILLAWMSLFINT